MIDLELSKVNVKELGDNHELITITPLPRGYGMTLGNALRRVLLSSLEGAAITAVKIEGVTHEFSAIKGVKDSVIDIILNLKKVRFIKHTKDPVIIKLKAKKAGIIKAGDFEVTSDIEVINKDQYITTLENKAKFEVEAITESSIGYSPVINRERRKKKDPNLIEIDALFTPILKVKYSVADTRVGQDVDLDKLDFEIRTDGSITPRDALAQSAGIMRNYFSLLDPKCLTPEKNAFEFQKSQSDEESDDEDAKKGVKKYTPVEVLKLSPRTLNALVNNEIKSVEQLITYNESRLSNLKGFGARALIEVKDALAKEGHALSDE